MSSSPKFSSLCCIDWNVLCELSAGNTFSTYSFHVTEWYSYTVIILSVIIIIFIIIIIIIIITTTTTTTKNFIFTFIKHEYDKSKGKFFCTQTLCFESR